MRDLGAAELAGSSQAPRSCGWSVSRQPLTRLWLEACVPHQCGRVPVFPEHLRALVAASPKAGGQRGTQMEAADFV